MLKLDLYPGGKPYALTMSYDDGQIHDRRLIDIFNKYGLKGTFHLNSGRFDEPERVTSAEIASLYQGHEVSCHTKTHPFLEKLPTSEVMREINEDKARLEELCGYVVRGMSYPFGTYTESVIRTLRECGMEYSRTTLSTMGWGIPEDFMKLHPSCHHNACMELLDRFDQTVATRPYAAAGAMLYIWGHSYEFDRQNNWELIEDFSRRIGGRADIWYATNIEIVDYVNAQKALRISFDGKKIYNPSAISVWVNADGNPVEIRPGEHKSL